MKEMLVSQIALNIFKGRLANYAKKTMMPSHVQFAILNEVAEKLALQPTKTVKVPVYC